LAFAPVIDLGSDVWSFIFFVWEEWWVSAATSAIVIYLSWRFFLLYACMHWPPPRPGTIAILYIPGLILPFWNMLNYGDAAKQNGGAPPSPEAKMDDDEGADVENGTTGDAENDLESTSTIFAFGCARTIQSVMFRFLKFCKQRRSDFLERCDVYAKAICVITCMCCCADLILLFVLFVSVVLVPLLVLSMLVEVVLALEAALLGPWLLLAASITRPGKRSRNYNTIIEVRTRPN